MATSAADYRDALANHASGVVVITTVDADGCPHGFTASSFSSVSLEPPTVLFCLAKSAQCYAPFTLTQNFAVSILGSGHETVAARFATRGADKFRADETEQRNGAVFIRDAAARLHCNLWRHIDCGDHTVFMCRVVSASSHGPARALVYHRRKFLRQGAGPILT